MGFIGSSPCVWGQVKNSLAIAPLSRIIPMRVGTSIQTVILWHYLRDHPHACGDKSIHRPSYWAWTGSSPCVWGQEVLLTELLPKPGIIPMRVGTSFTPVILSKYLEDHPHACGDKQRIRHKVEDGEGSSPCVWGQGSS